MIHPSKQIKSQTLVFSILQQKLPCATFAVGRSVKWKNGVNPGGKAAAFKKSMSLDEVRERLITLGFYGDGSADTSNNNSDTKKFSSSISERLETLSNMHKKGLLTEEEFQKAKPVSGHRLAGLVSSSLLSGAPPCPF